MNLLKRLVQLFLSSLIISLFLIYSVANAQTEGEWSGSTSESGKVYFAVNGNTVQNFLVEVCVSGGSGGSGCFENVYTFSIPITGNTFSYRGISSDLTKT
jgi:hypothetical protein